MRPFVRTPSCSTCRSHVAFPCFGLLGHHNSPPTHFSAAAAPVFPTLFWLSHVVNFRCLPVFAASCLTAPWSLTAVLLLCFTGMFTTGCVLDHPQFPRVLPELFSVHIVQPIGWLFTRVCVTHSVTVLLVAIATDCPSCLGWKRQRPIRYRS